MPRQQLTGCTPTSSSRTCSIHFSNKSFIDGSTLIIDGSGYAWRSTNAPNKDATTTPMPNPLGGNYTSYGNTGYGYVRITYDE